MRKWAGQRVLVTGGTGFIGSHVVDALLDKQAQVRVLAHYNSAGHLGNLAWLDGCNRADVEVCWGDLRDPDSVRRAVKGSSKVLHLGALVAIPYSYQDPRHVVDVNVIGTLNVLTAARDESVERVVHTSTSEVYGTPESVPITEEHGLKGQSPYASVPTRSQRASSVRMAFPWSPHTRSGTLGAGDSAWKPMATAGLHPCP